MEKYDVIVVGAGLTGLTVAHHLNKKKVNFKVLEKSNRYGGVIHTVKENGFIYEEGPNTGVIGWGEVADLFDDLKDLCELEVASDNVKKRYILKNGKWQALPMGLKSAINTPLFALKDKFRLLLEPFRKLGKNSHETLAELVKRRMGNSFLDYAIDPFILGVYAGDPNKLVPKYALPKLYNLEQNYGSFIGGAVKKKFEKKDEQTKKATRKVFSAKMGLSSLTSALYISAGKDKFILSADGISIKPNDTNEGYTVKYQLPDGKWHQLIAKNIISTVSGFALPNVFPFINKSLMDKISSLYYARVIEVTLGFKVWKGIDLDGYGGLIPHKEKRDILGILFLSALLKDKAPEGGALITIFMGGVRRDEVVDYPDERVKEIIEKEVTDLMGLEEFNPDLFKIIRHNKAIPQYYADSGERFEAIKQIEDTYKGLILGGNIRNGIGMADRIKQGRMLADVITK